MRRFVTAGALALVTCTAVWAADAPSIGQIKTATEPVWVMRGDARVPAAIGDAVYEKDVVETGKGGKVGITLSDNTMLSVGSESRLALDTFRFDSSALKGNLLANMQRGTLAVTTGDIARTAPDAMKIQTPSAVLGARGTDFLVRVVER